MRKFVIGDIHGAYRALKQCLERSGFDYAHDQLICLGDVCDGWPQTKESFDELLKIKNLVFVMGNHDFWGLKWAKNGTMSHIWLNQGGRNTITSYHGESMTETHVSLLEGAHDYYILEDRLFVHAGIKPDKPIDMQTQEEFLWDRSMVKEVMDRHYSGDEVHLLEDFKTTYVGHTPIHNFGYFEPIKSCGVWLMDTGAGWDGTLSMMNIDTEEIFCSDKVTTLYPPNTGRMKQ
ncbi:MAG: metallophosphoesterase [Fulvivirga sp.]